MVVTYLHAKMGSIGQKVQKLWPGNTDTHKDRQTHMCNTFTYPLSRVVITAYCVDNVMRSYPTKTQPLIFSPAKPNFIHGTGSILYKLQPVGLTMLSEKCQSCYWPRHVVPMKHWHLTDENWTPHHHLKHPIDLAGHVLLQSNVTSQYLYQCKFGDCLLRVLSPLFIQRTE